MELAQIFYDRPIRFMDLTIYFGGFPTSIASGLLVTGVTLYDRDVEGVGRLSRWPMYTNGTHMIHSLACVL